MDDGDPLSEQQQHHIARVARRGRDLLALVNDILELSKLEAGLAVLQPDWLELNTLVTRVSEDMSILADERGVTLKLALDAHMPPLRADEHKLERVLVNLLSNAIKFTLKDGSVVLRAWHQSEPGPVDMSNYVFISIADTGQGIPQHKLKRLFKKYGQADDKHGQTGTGLGLAICKEIVEAHQGRIWVQSQEGEGTTITLTLPVNGPAKVVGVELNNAEKIDGTWLSHQCGLPRFDGHKKCPTI